MRALGLRSQRRKLRGLWRGRRTVYPDSNDDAAAFALVDEFRLGLLLLLGTGLRHQLPSSSARVHSRASSSAATIATVIARVAVVRRGSRRRIIVVLVVVVRFAVVRGVRRAGTEAALLLWLWWCSCSDSPTSAFNPRQRLLLASSCKRLPQRSLLFNQGFHHRR